MANEFFVKYAYNPITDEYEKFIIKTHIHTADGTGLLSASAKTITDTTKDFTDLPISIGDTICFPEIGLSTFITAITATILTVATGPGADQGNTIYFIGPYFNYDCYLSALQNFAQDTGITRDREQSEGSAETVVFKSGKIESKYIRDANTMLGYLQSLIERYTLQLDLMTIDTTAIVEQLSEGDIITVNSDHISAARKLKKWMVLSIESVAVRESCTITLIERRRAKDPFQEPPELLIDNSQFTNTTGWTLPTAGSTVTLTDDDDFAETAAKLSGNVSTFPAILSENIAISENRTYILNIDAQKLSGNRQYRVRAIFKDATSTLETKNLITANTPGHARWENHRVLFGPNETITIPTGATRVQISIAAPGTGTNTTVYHFSNVQLLERA